MSEDDVVKLLKGSVSPQRVGELARERGIDFQLTPEVESQLRTAGADDSLLRVLKQIASNSDASAPSTSSTLIVNSNVGGAKVYVDDVAIGDTSSQGRLKIPNLVPGKHQVRVSLDGYHQVEDTVTLAEGETNDFHVILTASNAAAAKSTTGTIPTLTAISPESGNAPLSSAAISEMVQGGRAFKASGEYADAVQLFSRAAERNDPKGEAELGMMYADGLGVERDFQKAAALMRKAADQGYSRAQYRLGDFYYRGLGVNQDSLQALQWYQKAAYQGDTDAEKGLGIMYQYGLGVAKDEAQAAYWFKKADPAWLPSMPFITSPIYNSATTFKVSLIIGNVWAWTAHDGVLSVASSGIAYTETEDSSHNFTAACADVVEVKGNSSAKLWAAGTFHIKVRGPEYNFLPAWWKSLPKDKNERKAFCNSEITSIIKAVTASCGTISR